MERAFHLAFGGQRVNPKREFFSIEPERVIAVLSLLAVADATPQVEQELSAGLDSDDRQSRETLKRSRRPRMNLGEMGIPVGAQLVYRDDAEATVTVLDDKTVDLRGEALSLTAATQRLMGTDYQVSPTPYWSYDGRSLRSIYEDTYLLEGDSA